ncbi:hypothetical protein, partial [Methanosalsum natronophilum]|uniref:hypothetical protein n=1 Tax=Methanosalsum natronophilum TaxID=768733 RepID=UPI0021678B88
YDFSQNHIHFNNIYLLLLISSGFATPKFLTAPTKQFPKDWSTSQQHLVLFLVCKFNRPHNKHCCNVMHFFVY